MPEVSASFWRDQDENYNLVGSHCKKCGRYFIFPKRDLCPFCRRKGKLEEYQFKGTGKVISFTVIRANPPSGFEYYKPYAVALIELEEGARLMAQIVSDPEEVHIGMKVKSVFRRIKEPDERGVILYGTKFVKNE